MYLFSRLVGVGIYTLVMLVFFAAITTQSKRQIRRTLTVYWLIIGLMGYFFVPPSGFDLNRLIPRMRQYVGMPFSELLEHLTGVLTPGERLYYWLIGLFNNAHLLPCISGLISFGLCFKILKDITKKEINTSGDIALALLLFMCRGCIIMAVDTIRSFMSSAIIAWCVYDESINRKKIKRHWYLYVFACSMHAIGYVFVFLRLLFWVADKGNSVRQKLTRVVGGLAVGVLGYLVLQNQIQLLLQKASNYYQEGQAGTSYFYIWEGALAGMTLVIVVYMLIYISQLKFERKSEADFGFSQLCRFISLISVLCLAALFIEFNMFLRTSYFLSILLIPLSLDTLKLARINSQYKGMKNIVLLSSMSLLVLAATRGYLCSLKFFE